MAVTTTVATGYGPASWLDVCARGTTGESLGDGDACGRRFSCWGRCIIVPPAMSSTGGNPVHSWTSDGGAICVVPFLKASLWKFVSAVMSPSADVLCLFGAQLTRDGEFCIGKSELLHQGT